MSFAYLPLYTGDYLRDTRHLSPLKHGIYLLALMHCWDSKGPMPLDEQECAGICNCRSTDEIEALRYVLARYFVQMDDGHYNKRMAEEVVRHEQMSRKFSDAGLKSAEVRREKARRGARERAEKRTEVEGRLNLGSTEAEGRSVSLSLSPSPSLTPTPTPERDTPLRGVSPGASLPVARKKREPKAKPPSAEVWTAYSEAYQARYGALPVRNASVNGQLAQFVGRIGGDEAPAVARFYLGHQSAFYVRSMHPVGMLLRDAEKLRTEWATGRTVTNAQAALTDRAQTNFNAFAPLLAEARKREAENGK